jgi:hypothetical protein
VTTAGSSVKIELEHHGPSVAASTLTDHLTRLEGVGPIEVVEREGLERGQPYRYSERPRPPARCSQKSRRATGLRPPRPLTG